MTIPNTLLFRFVLPEPKIVRFRILNASPRRSMRTSSLIRKLLARLTLSSLFQKSRTFGLYLVAVAEDVRRLGRELRHGLEETIDGRDRTYRL